MKNEHHGAVIAPLIILVIFFCIIFPSVTTIILTGLFACLLLALATLVLYLVGHRLINKFRTN